MIYDVAILGAGASGLMTAAWLNAHSDLTVCVIEGNAKAGAKIRISGGGKCNLTNVCVTPEHYLGDEKLVASVLEGFDEKALLSWVRQRGCEPVLRKGRYYFCPRSARELIDLLMSEAAKSRFYYEERIVSVTKGNGFFSIQTQRQEVKALRVIVATGGASFASAGATDIGLRIARHFGIRTVPFRPALAGMTLQKDQFWMKTLSGVSLPVRIRVADKVLQEDMLFAHRGISGPAVLSTSLYWEKGSISIDFLAGKNIDALIARGGNKKLSTALPLPKRFVTAFLQAEMIEDKPCSALDKSEYETLRRLGDYTFAPAGVFGFGKAEVSKGGVACTELEIPSCESKKVTGLYFIGEVADVTGELGGYNFQWAFASAVSTVRSIIETR